jgi:LacI family transcriptional regulator
MTLEDVAKLTGVSRSTVSRVINGDPKVSEATREKVDAVIQSINFQPNLAARGLAAGRTGVLGLVIPMGVTTIFTDPYFPQLIQGVSSACNAREYSVMLWLADPEYERRMIQQILYNGLVDGVVVASMLMNDPIIEALTKRNLPFVLVGRHPTNDRVSYVDVDNRNAAREAVLHLIRLRRRRIGIITGPLNMIAGSDRYKGYLDGLHERGLVPEDELITEGDFTETGGYLAMQRMLKAEPDAVFACSDVMASGALHAILDAGLKVPQDIALIGYDDLPLASRTTPPLTTVRQPTQRLGSMAVELLIDLIKFPERQTRRVILPTELVVRDSCGPLPGVNPYSINGKATG